jgi:hypothetical protein
MRSVAAEPDRAMCAGGKAMTSTQGVTGAARMKTLVRIVGAVVVVLVLVGWFGRGTVVGKVRLVGAQRSNRAVAGMVSARTLHDPVGAGNSSGASEQAIRAR